METKENWISEEGYSIKFNQLNKHIITGNLQIRLGNNHLATSFEGLVNAAYANTFEFCFIAEWFCQNSGWKYCATFAGKNFFKKQVEYIYLDWLLQHKNTKQKRQNPPVKGMNKFIKSLEKSTIWHSPNRQQTLYSING